MTEQDKATAEMNEANEYAKKIMQKMGEHTFQIDLLKDPEEAILSRNIRSAKTGESLTERMWEKWNDDYLERIFARVAEETGADLEEIRHPENRTPKIQAAILKAAADEQNLRTTVFFKSRYYHACSILRELHSMNEEPSDKDPIPMDDDTPIPIKGQTILYFFARYNINPVEVKPLEEKQIQDLKDIFYRLDKFYFDNPLSKDAPETAGTRLFIKFIEQDNPDLKDIIATEIQETKNEILKAKLCSFTYTLDKVGSSLYGIEPGIETALKAESDRDNRRGKQANIYVLINYEDMQGTGVTISRVLTQYDKRVFLAAANLKDQGNNTVTTAQIYEAMGNRGRPSAAQREKILKSLETMAACRVMLNNTEEAELYKDYDKVVKTFYLLPTKIEKGYINGLIVNDAITIMETPELFKFAKDRGQIAQVPVSLLESPISQTESALALEDYLFTRILHFRNGRGYNNTILLDTLFNKCKITDRKQKARTKEKIETLLKHYKKEQFIKGFSLTADKITINL